MIETLLSVQLTGHDGSCVLQRTVWLPSIPPRGMDLAGVAEGNVVVESAVYDAGDGTLLVELEAEDDRSLALADLLESYGPGWQECSPDDVYELTDDLPGF